jgi:beta-glucuronidase
MKKQIAPLILLSLLTIILSAQDNLIINVYNRTTISLDGEWHYIIDPYENGYYNYRYEAFDQQPAPWASAFFLNSKPRDSTDLIEYDFDKMPTLQVPGDWNSQSPELLYYEGSLWYKKSFDYNQLDKSKRVHLYFGAANYKAEVYFNGQKLGTHTGGFTPFNFEVTDLLKEKDNLLVVKVDNKRLKEGVPTLNTDWWNYGGLTRCVQLIETARTFIEDYNIQLKKGDLNTLKGYVQLNGEAKAQNKITLDITELNISTSYTTDNNGRANFEIPIQYLQYWEPSNPHLYTVTLSTGVEKIIDQIGFRTIETRGAQILLNKQPIYLKGISIHEESPLRNGRAHTLDDAEQLLDWALELGCNYVRLAHYPHNEHMLRLADKKGLMVWEEIPVYWTILWENEATYLNAEQQLTEMIRRDKNRASTIIWSMANETPNVPARNTFLNKLATKARSLDATRLISAALEQKDYPGVPDTRTINDPFADVVDVLSFNQYIGWYDGLPDKCGTISWKIDQDKPLLISEFGAGAKAGRHKDKNTRWTEEYQEYLYEETLAMIERIEKVQGFSPWILIDFRSPRRVLPLIQDGWNRKGLLSEKGEKKKAFYTLQKYYLNKAPH